MNVKITRSGYDPKLDRNHPDNFDPTLEGGKTCEMINPHHPDCECPICKSHKDEVCAKPAIGRTTDGGVRVCEACAKAMESEGFEVTYDARTT